MVWFIFLRTPEWADLLRSWNFYLWTSIHFKLLKFKTRFDSQSSARSFALYHLYQTGCIWADDTNMPRLPPSQCYRKLELLGTSLHFSYLFQTILLHYLTTAVKCLLFMHKNVARIKSTFCPTQVLDKIHKAALSYEAWKEVNRPNYRPWRGIGEDNKPLWPRLIKECR